MVGAQVELQSPAMSDATNTLPSDLEIAERVAPRPLPQVVAPLGLGADDLELVGDHKAKLRPAALASALARPPRGKLILITAITATRKGAGKTVTAIGLGQAFGRLGLRHALCLRQPSLGPTFGQKGGAAGGGYAQLMPMADINLHFTGDSHAVTTAHNLLAALVDNHAYFADAVDLDPARITFPRVLDLCDRQLRHARIGTGSQHDGFAHDTRFDITAASEIMAVLALARDAQDLEARLARIVVGADRKGASVRAGQLAGLRALPVLLQHALRPNLVQSLEGTPAFVHAGPFANIAHGCSSVIATRAALALSDYVVTEAGFGADLGAEKFVHIKCRQAGLSPALAVLVVTLAALRRHGGVADSAVNEPNLSAASAGLPQLRVHAENLHKLGVPVVVALNAFPSDSAAEVALVRACCDTLGLSFAVSDAYARGGEGCVALAQEVQRAADASQATPRFLYELSVPLREKIERLATELYRADGVDFEAAALADLARLHEQGFGELPVCMAKTQHSLSDDAKLVGVPTGHRLRVRGLEVSAGAGFVVALTGAITRMPGMPAEPSAHRIHLDEQGRPRGLF
jgi:formate--tetrahydrofolate ligase